MAHYVTLPGSKRMPLPHSRPAGPVDRSQMDSLTVRIRTAGNFADLEKRVYEEAAKPLAERTYLTREQFAETHGASEDDLDKVEHYAQTHNLMVVHRDAAERAVVVSGSLGDLLNAFPAEVEMYHHSGGTYRGRSGEIKTPSELEGIVTGVFGYDSRPRGRRPRRAVTPRASGPGGVNGVSPVDFARRYNFPTTFHGTPVNGSGQTIAIIELGGGFRASDLKLYFKEIAVPLPKVTMVSVDHAGNSPTNANSDDGEVMLDIEVAGAVAPKANIAVYFAPNNGDKGFIDAISAAVHDKGRNPGVISISWGGPESANDQQGNDAFHQIFVAAAALGITVCAASGDHGVADEAASDWDNLIHVDHPAVDPLVLGCGGTEIDANNQDVVWNEGTPFDKTVSGGGGWAGGGGISQVFAVPPYQTGVTLPAALANGHAGRGVPDIAMSATNYFTRVDSFEGASGGTSAVAPLMAGLVALLNQAKGKRVGALHQFLYKNATTVMNDVTQGNNGIANTVAGYQAGKGWDACTGLGTPNGTAILNAL